MALDDFDRYSAFRKEGIIEQPPFVQFTVNPADKYEEWIEGSSRLDKISLKYYSSPLYDWAILFANPEYITEFDIPDGVIIRIPFPLERVLFEYKVKIAKKIEI